MRWVADRVVAMVGVLIVVPGCLVAQAKDTPPADKKPVAKAAADTGKYALITTNDLWYAGGFIAATVGVAQLDQTVAQKLQHCSATASCPVTATAKAFNFVGVPGAFIASGGMYVIGQVARNRGLADVGLHTGEAVLLAELTTYAVKFAFGRERPSFAGTSQPGQFSFGRGLKGNAYSSFPSGHASGAFASAASITAEISSRWPKATIFAAPLLYGGAGMVAWARLQSNAHWLSDVFMGAGLGTMIGIKTVRFNHKHPHNRIDRLLLPRLPTVVPTTSGVRLMWTVHPTFLDRGPVN